MKKLSNISFEDLKEYYARQHKEAQIKAANGENRCCFICFPQACVNIFRLIRIRSMMTTLSICALFLMSCAFRSNAWWALSTMLVLIWAETVFLCIWNKGRDFYW